MSRMAMWWRGVTVMASTCITRQTAGTRRAAMNTVAPEALHCAITAAAVNRKVKS